MALQKLNAQILEGGLTFDNTGNMTITGNLYATDIGDDDDPIEDFYVSEDSIWIGDQHKVQISSDGKMKFRKRKTTTVPAVIAAAGGTSAGALTHSGKSSLSELKKKHWKLYARSLGGGLASAKNKDIFRDNKADYQQESNADVWQVNDTGEIHSSVNVGIGNADPVSSLHITGTDSLILPVGTTAQRGTATQGALRYNTTTSGFEGYNGTEWGALGGGGLTDEDEDTYITAEATADSDDLDFWTAGTKRMTIDQTGNVVINEDGNDIDFRIEADDINNIFFVTGYGSGKVGVGTAAPNVKFEVLDIENDIFMRVQSKIPNGNKKNGIQLWGDRNWQILNDGSATYGTADYFHIQDATASYASRLTIDTSGNIGIGTTSPGAYKLNVNGDIYCNRITTTDVLTKYTHLGWMMGG